MRWLIMLAILLGLLILTVLGIALAHRIFAKWVSVRYLNFDRVFSSREQRFVENAKSELSAYARGDSYRRKLHGLTYFFAFLPILIFGFLLIWIVAVAINEGLSPLSNFSEMGEPIMTGDAPISLVLGVTNILGAMGSIFISGWMTYWATSFVPTFLEWMVLTKSSYNQSESDDSILKRRLDQIEFDVRIERLDGLRKFEPEQFLRGIALRHGNYCLILGLIMCFPALIAYGLYANASPAFYENGYSYKATLFSPRIEKPYNTLEAVGVECQIGHKNKLDQNLHFYDRDIKIGTISINVRDLSKLDQLVSRLTEQNVKFTPHYYRRDNRSETRAYSNQCISKSLKSAVGQDYKKMQNVLRTNELSESLE